MRDCCALVKRSCSEEVHETTRYAAALDSAPEQEEEGYSTAWQKRRGLKGAVLKLRREAKESLR